jgi:DNA-binding transcriptional LysR family regulator
VVVPTTSTRKGSEQAPVRTPEIAELRAFCAAVDLGTLGRAAVSMQISQPALSKRLRSLEALAGVELLERSHSGVTPTSAGRRLYPEARRLLQQAEVVEGMLAAVTRETPPLRLAVSHTIAEFFLPPVLVAYQADGVRHPPVELTIANSSAVRRMVLEGQATTGITAVDPERPSSDELEEIDLRQDEVVVAVPESHSWFRREEVSQAALLSTPLVMRDPDAHDRRCAEAVLAERGLEFAEPLVEVGSTAVAKREALQRSAPVLISALSLDESRDRLHRRPVAGLRFPRKFVIVCRSLTTLPRQDRDFIEFLRRST